MKIVLIISPGIKIDLKFGYKNTLQQKYFSWIHFDVLPVCMNECLEIANHVCSITLSFLDGFWSKLAETLHKVRWCARTNHTYKVKVAFGDQMSQVGSLTVSLHNCHSLKWSGRNVNHHVTMFHEQEPSQGHTQATWKGKNGDSFCLLHNVLVEKKLITQSHTVLDL